MLRFFSRRGRPRRDQKAAAAEQRYAHLRSHERERAAAASKGAVPRTRPDKNLLQCKVILLDGTDLSLDIPVRI